MKKMNNVSLRIQGKDIPLSHILKTALTLVLIAVCIPVFSLANGIYSAAGSINIADKDSAVSQENLDNFIQQDTSSTLSDSDEDIILDANAQMEAFFLENQEIVKAVDDRIINILLIGCDANDYEGWLRSDSMIILSIDLENGKVKLISLMRDMRVKVAGSYDKLNAAFAYDSSGQLLLDTIEENFLIHIDDFVCINYRAFKDAVDAIGGIYMTVDEKDIKAFNECIYDETQHFTEPGYQLLNGTKALAYCQMRAVGTDVGRTARQRMVMTELLKMAKDMSLFEMKDLIEAVLPNLHTNMSQGELFYLALQAVSMDGLSIEQMRIPMDNTWSDLVVDGRWYISFDHRKNVEALHEMIFGDLEADEENAETSSSDAKTSDSDAGDNSDE